ncbi:MAG: carboxy terminal-processing peptidase [Bacteroidales bacterium]
MTDLGSLKMTVQKFYRITGDATQLHGVTPDIIFPDYYNYMDIGEKDLDNAMPWDEISNVSFSQWDLDFDEEYIVDISNKRILNDSILVLIEENGRRMKEMREDTEVNLSYNAYKDEIEKREAESKKYDRIGKDTLNLVIEVLQDDLPEVLADTSKSKDRCMDHEP